MLVDAVKFSPLGDRGYDGAGLDGDFYLQGGDDYLDAANRETFLVVQIETPLAVDNVNEIAAVEGVDGLFVGPGDLGMRLRRTETDLTLEQSLQRVAAAASSHGTAWGCPASSREQVRQLLDQGAQLIAYGGDFSAFIEMLKNRSADLDAVYDS